MPQTVTLYRVLISSPADCSAERDLIPKVLARWNAASSYPTGAVLEPVLWESHAVPELGDRPQAILNEQLVVICDLLVGTFWTRLGTDTGKAPSGTVEEIQEFIAAGKLVLLYFSTAPVRLATVDQEQYRRLAEWKAAIRSKGLTFDYQDTAQFERLFQSHLNAQIGKLHRSAPPSRYAEIVAALYHLIDVYGKYAADPPTATLEEYGEAEDVVKRWINLHRLDEDPDLLAAMTNVGLRIRRFVDEGNSLVPLIGGTGRPAPETLTQHLNTLIGEMRILVAHLRGANPGRAS